MNNKMNWIPSSAEAEKLITELIQLNTTQPEGNEKLITDYIINCLPENISYKRIEHSRNRESLVVKIDGDKEQGGIAFVGHIDVVAPGNSDDWKYAPFEAKKINQKIYGRGASDMKGGVAAMLLLMNGLLKSETLLKKPVYFCFTADEEKAGMGITEIEKQKILQNIDEVVICEPTNGQISVCEKGAIWAKFIIKGISSHASRPDLGVNPIEYGYLLFNEIKTYMNNVAEHQYLGKASASVTKINAGYMTNIIPDELNMEMDIRTIPGINSEDIIKFIKQQVRVLEEQNQELKIDWEITNHRIALETSENCELVKLARKIMEDIGMSSELRGSHFYTDASQLIPSVNVPFLIAGPGNDALAHCANEFIEVESIVRFASFYACLVNSLN